MLSNGTYLWPCFVVGSNVRLQMDRVRCSKDKAEVEDGGLECWQVDLEERVRVVCPGRSWRLGICKPLSSGNF